MVKKKTKNTGRKAKAAKKQSREMPFLKQVQIPAAMGAVVSRRGYAPIMASTNGSCIVKNFELMTPFGVPSADFRIDGYQCNPGNVDTFPWLSGIASAYQKFRFRSLRFLYSATCSTAATGKVFVQLQYDSLDTTPTTFGQVMAGDGASSGPVWYGSAVNSEKAFDSRLSSDANIYVDLDPSKLTQEWYYVRDTANVTTGGSLTGTVPGGLTFAPGTIIDPSALPCKILFGSYGAKSGDTRISPGDLYVSYVVELAEPVASALNN